MCRTSWWWFSGIWLCSESKWFSSTHAAPLDFVTYEWYLVCQLFSYISAYFLITNVLYLFQSVCCTCDLLRHLLIHLFSILNKNVCTPIHSFISLFRSLKICSGHVYFILFCILSSANTVYQWYKKVLGFLTSSTSQCLPFLLHRRYNTSFLSLTCMLMLLFLLHLAGMFLCCFMLDCWITCLSFLL